MDTLPRTRLAGAWTRTGSRGGLGRLHAVRRVAGALEERALCGFKIPAKAQRTRPFPIFEETDPRACSTCVVDSWDTP